MAMILTLRHERVDVIPVIIGLANQVYLAEILDAHLGMHGLQEGLNNGQLAAARKLCPDLLIIKTAACMREAQ
jgi:hypothetical protein